MTFREAMTELGRLAGAPDVPREIADALLRLIEHPCKFVWLVKAASPAIGTLDEAAILEPSDLLMKLVEAMRAFDWPQVAVLIRSCQSGLLVREGEL